MNQQQEQGSNVVNLPVPVVLTAQPVARVVKAVPALKKINGKRANKGGIRMTISKRDGLPRWEVQLRGKQFKHLPGGKFYKGGILSEGEAQRILDEAKADARKPINRHAAVPMEMPIVGKGGLFDLYEQQCAADGVPLNENQLGYYRRMSKHPVLAKAKLGDVGYDLMKAYAKERKNFAGVKTNTINSEYTYFHRAVSMMTLWNKWGGFDPLANVWKLLANEQLLSESEARINVPTNEQLSGIINWFAARDVKMAARKDADKMYTRLADFISYMALQGNRQGEGVEMELRHLKESADGTATMGLWRKDAHADINGKSKTRRRWVPDMPLVQAAYDIIKRQPTYIAWKKLSARERAESTLRVFPYCANTIAKAFRECTAELGCRELHFHDLRAKAITELVKIMPVTDVMKFSGHRTIKSLQIYVRHVEADLAAMSKRTASIQLQITPVVPMAIAA